MRSCFLALLDLPAAERQAWLDRELSAEDAVRAEVEALLAAHEDSEDLLEPPSRTEHEHIGPYRVVCELGRGGMGVVYLGARADGAFVQQVALKLLKRGMDSEELVQRFQAERQTLASLDHPYIARVLDGGSTEEGRPYFAMELIDGQSLSEYCTNARPGQEARLRLFMKICSAVTHAHQRLVVHRDLKPDNVHVVHGPDGAPSPKLLDFGIAKLVADVEEEARRRGGTELFWQTPAYASPEQRRGESVGTASDVYSLGLLLYALLAGQPPPVEEREPSGRIAPPSARSEVGPIAADLDAVVLRALEHEVERRYGSAQELAEDVRRFLDSEPVLARPSSAAHRARLLLRRQRVSVAAGSAFLALLVVSLVLVSAQARRADAAARTSRQINELLSWLLTSVDASNQGRNTNVLSIVERAARRIEAEFAQDPAVRAYLEDTLGRTYRHLGFPDRAQEFLSGARDLRVELYGEDSPEVAASDAHLAELALDRLDTELARELARPARELSSADEDPLALANALELTGRIDLAEGLVEEADRKLERAVELTREHGRSTELLAERIGLWALALKANGQREKARGRMRESIRLLRQVSPSPTAGLARALFAAGMEEYEAGSWTHALENYTECLQIRKELLGLLHPNTALVQSALGGLYAEIGRSSEALELTSDPVLVAQQLLGENNPLYESTLFHRAKALLAAGQAVEAASTYRELCDSYARRGPSSMAFNVAEARLLEALYEAGQWAELDQRADAMEVRLARSNNPGLHGRALADARTARARAHLAQGELERARECVHAALLIPLEERGWQAVWTGFAQADLAEAMGDSEAALAHMQAALDRLEQHSPQRVDVLAWTRLRLARALWGDGQREAARHELEAATSHIRASLPVGHAWRAELDAWSAELHP